MKFSNVFCFVAFLAFGSNVVCLERKVPFVRNAIKSNIKLSGQSAQVPVGLLPSFTSLSSGKLNGVSVVAQSESISFIDKVWNDDTKLATYLAVWYLGNIYCE